MSARRPSQTHQPLQVVQALVGLQLPPSSKVTTIACGSAPYSTHLFVVKEISYAPVIAAAMLKRQQAQAMVEARKTIVEGAVAMSVDANEQLKSAGIQLDQKESARLVSNLLTVICSEGGVAPTLPLQGQ